MKNVSMFLLLFLYPWLILISLELEWQARTHQTFSSDFVTPVSNKIRGQSSFTASFFHLNTKRPYSTADRTAGQSYPERFRSDYILLCIINFFFTGKMFSHTVAYQECESLRAVERRIMFSINTSFEILMLVLHVGTSVVFRSFPGSTACCFIAQRQDFYETSL